MKGKITNEGRLYILRGDRYKAQYCPHYLDNSCGDWCPLFGEPVRYQTQGVTQDNKEIFRTSLHLCRIQLVFDEFEDERDHTGEELL